jgi:multidrug efflux pump subunit AcrA (membrane-fusion protein)
MKLATLLLIAACGGSATPDAIGTSAARKAQATAIVDDFDAVIVSKLTKVVPAPFVARIDELHVAVGQLVLAGEPLAVFDTRELRAKIEASKAEEAALRAEATASGAFARQATIDFKSTQRLVKHGYVSEAELAKLRTQQVSELGKTTATLHRADAALATRKILEQQLADATVRAPFDGVVLDVHVKEGEVPTEHAPLFRLVAAGDLLVKFAVPDGKAVAVGDTVELRLDHPARTVHAIVKRLARQEPPINFTVVDAEIADRDLTPDLHVATQGHVRIADARGVNR